MAGNTAAALVAAGMLSVLIFPAVGRLLSRVNVQATPPAGEAPEIALEA